MVYVIALGFIRIYMYTLNSEASNPSSLQSWLGKLYSKLAFAYQRLVYLYRETRTPNLVEICKASRAGNSAVSSAIELFDKVDPSYIPDTTRKTAGTVENPARQ